MATQRERDRAGSVGQGIFNLVDQAVASHFFRPFSPFSTWAVNRLGCFQVVDQNEEKRSHPQ